MAKSPRFTIVTAMKNEGPYILEWIAHHLAIGFEHFIVVTNDCEDGTNEILERLQELGHVTLLINPKVIRPKEGQWQTTALSYVQYFPIYRRSEWILHCDVDEFVQINIGEGQIGDYLERFPDTDVVSITSVPYNSNGINILHDLPVMAQFTQRDRYYTDDRSALKYDGSEKPDMTAIKTMYRNEITFGTRRNHRPVHRKFSTLGRTWRDGSGNALGPEFTDTTAKQVHAASTIEYLQLNHYAIRSIEAALVKFDRGDVMGASRLANHEHYFRNYDNVGEPDTRAGKMLPKARKIMAKLHADPVLSTLHTAAFTWHKDRVAALLQKPDYQVLAMRLGYLNKDRDGPYKKEVKLARLPASASGIAPPNPFVPRPTIASMWIGGPMSFVEILVMQSFLDQGHPFVLYSIEPLDNVPEGVIRADPRDICPLTFPVGPGERHNNAVYADIFRLLMIRDTGAIWADLDAYCVRPFILPSPWLFGYEPPVSGKSSVANGVLGFPKDSKTLASSIDLVTQDSPIPPFFNGGRRGRLAERKARGESFGFQDFSWGASGPRLIDYYLRETGEIIHALPQNVLYPGPRAFNRPLLKPNYEISVFEHPETLSVHIFGKTKTFLREEFDGIPPDGSYLDLACKRHGIDPARYPV